MKKRVSKRLDQLREQPDHVRMRTASMFTVVSGVIIVGLWLTILLPAQLYLNSRGDKESAENTGNVQGAKTTQAPKQQLITPTISPTPTPQTIPVKIGE